jgi:hypothetical protein
MEIIRLVEGSDLPVKMTLRQLGAPRSTFYGWYQRYEANGFDGLQDQKPAPRPRWNTIPKTVRSEVLDMALQCTDLSPRELACCYTNENRYFVSESSVYRLLKEADLITSPAYVLMSADDAFKNPTTRVNEMSPPGRPRRLPRIFASERVASKIEPRIKLPCLTKVFPRPWKEFRRNTREPLSPSALEVDKTLFFLNFARSQAGSNGSRIWHMYCV